MSEGLDLKQLERKAWTSYLQDGIWDIFLGLLLLLLWMGPLFLDPIELPAMRMAAETGLTALLILAFWAGKRYITLPRLGRAEFGPARQSRRRKTAAVTAAGVLLTAILLIVAIAARQDPAGLGAAFGRAGAWIGLGFALMAGLVLGAGAYFLDFTRGYLHALLYAAAFAAAEVLHTPIGFLACGAIGLTVGLVVFVRFLRNHPMPAEEVPNV